MGAGSPAQVGIYGRDVSEQTDGGEMTDTHPAEPGGAAQEWRGQRLGLPPSGPGSLAPSGQRLAALAVDVILSGLVAGLFTAPHLPRNWSLLVFVVEYVAFTAAFGQTPGMRLVGLRVVRVDRPVRVGLVRAVIRTLLLALLVPALIWDQDARCVHDRLSQTAVVRA
ncbi:MAG: hypothetical protein V7637_2976 [Mycobacteriales bacterium]